MARNGFGGAFAWNRVGGTTTTSSPASNQEWELLSQQRWSAEPNIRKSPDDYPLEVDDSDLHPLMIGGVGGSTLLYGAQWMRLLLSDFRMHSLDGVGDDWPLTYDDLAPFYDKIDRAIGVSGVEGDPMYPPGMVPPLPPAPNRQNRTPRCGRDEQAGVALVARS